MLIVRPPRLHPPQNGTSSIRCSSIRSPAPGCRRDRSACGQGVALFWPDGPEHAPVVYAKTLAMFESDPEIELAALGEAATPTLLQADDDGGTRGHSAAVAGALAGVSEQEPAPRPALEIQPIYVRPSAYGRETPVGRLPQLLGDTRSDDQA